MKSSATSVEEYLASLPEEKANTLRAVRKVILKHLPKGYRETMSWGVIAYEVPLTTYPDTYNKKPLMYAGLAAQKNYFAVYLMNVYSGSETESWFQREYRATGKKLDMGKCCVRFKKLDDLPLELIGKAIARTSLKEYLKQYEATRKK